MHCFSSRMSSILKPFASLHRPIKPQNECATTCTHKLCCKESPGYNLIEGCNAYQVAWLPSGHISTSNLIPASRLLICMKPHSVARSSPRPCYSSTLFKPRRQTNFLFILFRKCSLPIYLGPTQIRRRSVNGGKGSQENNQAHLPLFRSGAPGALEVLFRMTESCGGHPA